MTRKPGDIWRAKLPGSPLTFTCEVTAVGDDWVELRRVVLSSPGDPGERYPRDAVVWVERIEPRPTERARRQPPPEFRQPITESTLHQLRSRMEANAHDGRGAGGLADGASPGEVSDPPVRPPRDQADDT